MPLAFLPALQCFISLLHCPRKKSGLLPAGATGDPLPVAEGDACAAQCAQGALNLAPEIAAVHWMCLPTAGVDCTWAQSVGLPSLAATRLGSVCWVPAQELRTGPGTHHCVPLCAAVLAASWWDPQSLAASLPLWYLVYNLPGKGRCKDKQEEEIVPRRMSHCVCSSPSSE